MSNGSGYGSLSGIGQFVFDTGSTFYGGAGMGGCHRRLRQRLKRQHNL